MPQYTGLNVNGAAFARVSVRVELAERGRLRAGLGVLGKERRRDAIAKEVVGRRGSLHHHRRQPQRQRDENEAGDRVGEPAERVVGKRERMQQLVEQDPVENPETDQAGDREDVSEGRGELASTTG